MSDQQQSGPSQEPTPEEAPPSPGSAPEGERRERRERRSLIDLTRAERGEPERRSLPGLERRGPDDEDDPAPDGPSAA